MKELLIVEIVTSSNGSTYLGQFKNGKVEGYIRRPGSSTDEELIIVEPLDSHPVKDWLEAEQAELVKVWASDPVEKLMPSAAHWCIRKTRKNKTPIKIIELAPIGPRTVLQTRKWQIWVGEDIAGTLQEENDGQKRVCIGVNEGYGSNSKLNKWWGELPDRQAAMAFIKSEFHAYMPSKWQERLNKTNALD